MAGKHTTTSLYNQIQITFEDCDKDPRTCPHMRGPKVRNIIYDATCHQPLSETVDVIIDGVNFTSKLPKGIISKVLCGKCHPRNGTERI